MGFGSPLHTHFDQRPLGDVLNVSQSRSPFVDGDDGDAADRQARNVAVPHLAGAIHAAGVGSYVYPSQPIHIVSAEEMFQDEPSASQQARTAAMLKNMAAAVAAAPIHFQRPGLQCLMLLRVKYCV